MSAQTNITVCLFAGSGPLPLAWLVTFWLLHCVHDVCGAQSPHLSDSRRIQPGANTSQGNI